jgi:tRNA-specific 2-thiouridylase
LFLFRLKEGGEVSRVAVLMSGGVDSSAAALLLVRRGHEVVGITARMWDEGSRCCDEEDIYRAQRVCHTLGISHIVLDLRDEFRDHVVDSFRSGYLGGLTPNPCSVCNREIKFGRLFRAAMSFGCDLMATGHYAGLGGYGGDLLLREPASIEKSQTYFLALIRPHVLKRLVFPLDRVSKKEARAMLSKLGLPARVRESQDLCFVRSGRYEDFLRGEMSGAGAGSNGLKASHRRPGRLLDREGNVVGTHRGHFAYTVGQRLGYRGKRAYVIEKRPGTNEVVVGERSHLMAGRITAVDANWFAPHGRLAGSALMVKYRYNTPAVDAHLLEAEDGVFTVTTDKPCFAPAPGQVLACYRAGYLLGGGVIAGTAP